MESEMKVDASLAKDIDATKDGARAIEEAGYDGLWIGETKHEPFLQCLQAADVTGRVAVGTSIAIAFARTPMTVANSAFDLARYSKGRFVLGLGSQIKPHIERRFSMPWSHPAPRMREYILAMRAIWASWSDGTKLDFRGEFYTHPLMTPFFNPGPIEHPRIPVYIAAVNPLMCRIAGELCDGMHVHPFNSPKYLREIVHPAVAAALAA